jgi:hypothetical protein
MTWKIIQLLLSIGLIIGGLSGEFVLRGTESSELLVVAGFAWLAYDIYSIVDHVKKNRILPFYRLTGENNEKGMSVILAFMQDNLPDLSGETFKEFYRQAFFAAIDAVKKEFGDLRLLTVINGNLPVRIYRIALPSFGLSYMESFGRTSGFMLGQDNLDIEGGRISSFNYSLPYSGEKEGYVYLFFNNSIPDPGNDGDISQDQFKQMALPDFIIDISDNPQLVEKS